MIELQKVSHTYYTPSSDEFLEALLNVDVSIPDGRFVSFVGPSGCGKSSALNIIAGLIRPSSGSVLVDGRELGGVNLSAGYVTQGDTLLPWRRVDANIGIGLEVQKVKRKEQKARIQEVIDLVNLGGFEKSFPAQLSGGMRKRVGLARVLISAPRILLMDEPFAALDAQLRSQMHAELLKIWQQVGGSVIFVSHDIEEAVVLSDEIIVFAPRPGRVVARVEVPLARPRDIESVRHTSAFGELCAEVRSHMQSG